MSGNVMIRVRPNENHAASTWPDHRSGVRSRHCAWDLNQPDSSEPPPMAIGFCDYLREKPLSLRRSPISKMPQLLLPATSVESNAIPGWNTNRRSRFSRRAIKPTFASGRQCIPSKRVIRSNVKNGKVVFFFISRISQTSDVLVKGTRRSRI